MKKQGWAVDKSMALYHVGGWGAPYFFINRDGNMAVRPSGFNTTFTEEIDLMAVLQKIQEAGEMNTPLIIRFPEILKNRLEVLQTAFERAILLNGYRGSFQGVFPVKCNPDRYVVEDIVRFGRNFAFGLEAGSKPELLMTMACMCKASPDALLICNGYKDAEYVQLALIARQLGLNSVIVLEQEEELQIVLKMSQYLRVQPVIGVRAKLSTKHNGHWGETSGDKGKFGLSASEILSIVKTLKDVGMLDALQLLHFHIGSQIPSLSIVKEGVTEAAHIFCELSLLGAGMKYLDIGGGLGIDYDGSNSSASGMSIGYTVEEYAEQVVHAVDDACALKNVKAPTICCESGRGLVSHHSVLIFDAFSVSKPQHGGKELCRGEDVTDLLQSHDLPHQLSVLSEDLARLVNIGDLEGALACAKQLKLDCACSFKLGLVSLELRAIVDELYTSVSNLMCQESKKGNLRSLSKKAGLGMSDVINDQIVTYHTNLSIFKSVPDSWAIGQLFPIVPLHRLDEAPSVRAILCDLTCDSDGKISSFVSGNPLGKADSFLPLHKLEANRPYYLGMFLGGAYQEVLGSMHNLFGTTHVVHVLGKTGGSFQISLQLPGQTISDVLRAMLHDPLSMFEDIRSQFLDSFKAGRFGGNREATVALHILKCSFSSYTYLSHDQDHHYSVF
ncbi:hypothetical protein O6H91_16G076000 [Diphasiastrum complanatum]|nr:hypothetical protein O6H91_16G076000 [Diphasiastrum complanatum]